jgi:hypothetical protein
MKIEYTIVNMNDNTIVPFWPKWREKCEGWKKIFQWLYPWQNFPTLDGKRNIIFPYRFGTFEDAKDFLEKEIIPIGPNKYYSDLYILSHRFDKIYHQIKEY